MAGAKAAKAGMKAGFNGVRSGARAGVFAAGLLVERRSKVLVPVEYGNMRASGYTSWHESIPDAVRVGYTAKYAAAVHEKVAMVLKGKPRPSGKGVYWGPKGSAKFLERPFRESKGDIQRVIASYARKR